jgi:hypothetical protein
MQDQIKKHIPPRIIHLSGFVKCLMDIRLFYDK